MTSTEMRLHPARRRRGGVPELRPLASTDRPKLARLLGSLSPRTAELRYMSPGGLSDTDIQREVDRLMQGAPPRHFVWVATAPERGGEAIIGVAEISRHAETDPTGELGIVVLDEFQRQGVGRALAEAVVMAAKAAGVTTLQAYFEPGNEGVRRLLKSLGVEYSSVTQQGITEVQAELAA